jgi:hypothetical protein
MLSFRSLSAHMALQTAASVGDVQLFDEVHAAGLEESWWIVDPTLVQLPDILMHSALCTSSPCHEAIISGKTSMLQHLLSLGYTTPTWCLPPHMATIAFCNPPNLEAYDILAHDTKSDLTLRTPIFSIHILHFATICLEIALLKHIIKNYITPLETAGTTALGHTLLHISMLPLTDAHINIFSPKIFYSIHDVHTLDTKRWLPINLKQCNPTYRSMLSSVAGKHSLPLTRTSGNKDNLHRQSEMVLWLLESNTQDLGAQDVYGNTALHYLASSMWVNEELMRRVRAWEGGEIMWKESRNELGYSPEELLEDGKVAEREQWKTFHSCCKIFLFPYGQNSYQIV